MKLNDYFEQYKILIFSGNGGTGKTTLSAAVALEAAQSGKNVGLITIDPSRRLGAVFGMDISKETAKRLMYGEKYLDVFLINSPEVIKDFVLDKYSQDFYDKLLSNRLFAQISSVLSENQSVSTIYKLAQMVRSQKYDLIIVDTPPANHTLDFFRSPQQVIRIFQDNMVAKAVLEAKGVKWWSSKKVFTKILSFLVGEDFVREMEGFFLAILSFQEHIVKAASELEGVLKGKGVCYFLVTLPEPDKAQEILNVMKDLQAQNITVKDVLVNRAYPEWLDLQKKITDFPAGLKDFEIYYKDLWGFYFEQNEQLKKMLQSFQTGTRVYFIPERAFFKSDFSMESVQSTLKEHWL